MTDEFAPVAAREIEAPSMLLDTLAMAGPRLDADVVEMPLLLPRWQADALEDAARSKGMTTGQMLRRLIAELFPKSVSEAKR